MKMKIMLDEGARIDSPAHETDAGYDIYSREAKLIRPRLSGTFDTGVHVAIPRGYVGFLKSKSGLNVKHDLTGEGVIDSGYTGKIVVKLYNNGRKIYRFNKGDKLIQLVLLPIITPELEVVDSFEETERGSDGFGSTGK